MSALYLRQGLGRNQRRQRPPCCRWGQQRWLQGLGWATEWGPWQGQGRLPQWQYQWQYQWQHRSWGPPGGGGLLWLLVPLLKQLRLQQQ